MVALILSMFPGTTGNVTYAQDATIVVNAPTDDALGTLDGDNACSLREAIANANDNAATYTDCAAGSGDDLITFALGAAATIALDILEGPLVIEDDATGGALTIDGASANDAGDDVTIDGNNATRIFEMDDTAPTVLTLQNMSLVDGNADTDDGGAIYGDIDGSELTIDNMTFAGNRAYDGGALSYDAEGTVVIMNSRFTGNIAQDYGGAIYSGDEDEGGDGVLTIMDSSFIDNTSGDYGGAIYAVADMVTITDSEFTANESIFDDGGAILTDYNDYVIIDGCTFTGNTSGDEGGALYIYSDTEVAYVSNSTFTGNTAYYGGAIYNDVEEISYFHNLLIDNNTAVYYGGGIYGDDPFVMSYSTIINNDVLSSDYSGAGIYNSDPATISYSYFANNGTASGPELEGGAIYNDDDLRLYYTSFTGNEAADGGAIYNNYSNLESWHSSYVENEAIGIASEGGAIYNDNSDTIIINNTFTSNRATGDGEAIYNTAWDDPQAAYVIISFSTIAFNDVASDDDQNNDTNTGTAEVETRGSLWIESDCVALDTGAFTSLDYNIYTSGFTTNCDTSGTNDSTTPTELADFSVSGLTDVMPIGYDMAESLPLHELLEGSPAIDYVGNDDTECEVSIDTIETGVVLGVTTDQRQLSRPQNGGTDGGCDAGSYEYLTAAASELELEGSKYLNPDVDVMAGDEITYTVAITNNGPADLVAEDSYVNGTVGGSLSADSSTVTDTVVIPAGDAVTGQLASVEVWVNGLTHTAINQAVLALEGPNGHTVILLSGMTDDADVAVDLIFANGAKPLPYRSSDLTSSDNADEGSKYAPTDIDDEISNPPGALPPGPYFSTLDAAFGGMDADTINSDGWTLYAYDSTATEALDITSWGLNITTAGDAAWFSDDLPEGFEFESIVPDADWTCDYISSVHLINCYYSGELVANATTTVDILGTVGLDMPGTLENTVTITGTSDFKTDPDTTNNSSTLSDEVEVSADLTIEKTDGLASITQGDTAATQSYTITVTNNGMYNVTDAMVADTIPTELTDVTWTCTAEDGASCGDASGTGDIDTTVTLNLTGTVTLLVAGTLDLAFTGTLTNTAYVNLPDGYNDENMTDNVASDSTTVNGVTGPNRAPQAEDDTTATTFDTPVTIAVLDNDSDPDGDTLTVSAVTTPLSGTAVITNATSIVYTPTAGFAGTDVFTYTVSDPDGATDTAQVTVAVVETVIPAAPVVTSATETSDPYPTISGTAEAGVTITLTIDLGGGATVTYETTADAQGNWSIDLETATPIDGTLPDGGLTPGDYPVSAIATNEWGYQSQPTTVTLTITSGTSGTSTTLYLPLIAR
jgi:uncharacterized repeat protein (TIGR01451 family)